jgi:alpha-1,2-glucosyltransferase
VTAFRIQQTLHGRGHGKDEASAQTAMNVALFPLLFFFSGLFYTDVWSTIFVLAAYLATLREKNWVAGVFAWVTLWFRQTNIVWVVFMAGVYAIRKLEEMQEDAEKNGARELEVGMFLDPRRWGEVKIYNPPLTSDTKFTGRYLSTPIICAPLTRQTTF